jgi:formylglycine-generating enzyme required for sulfatase activity
MSSASFGTKIRFSKSLTKSIIGYWIPTQNEWYKAAFYDPTLNSGGGGYWEYPTRSNTPPSSVTANANGDGSAGSSGNFANITTTSDWDGQDGNVTTVGTNGGPSYYGTYDMLGNTSEWSENLVRGQARVFSGAYSLTVLSNWGANGIATRNISLKNGSIGFRIATINNPLSLSNFVSVGNINNNNHTTGFGSVPYTYQINSYEVTNTEYTQFLNAVASTDTYDLYDTRMNDPRGGISRLGTNGSYSYSVKTNYGNKPVLYVNWLDCARYCNWLTNGKPNGSQNVSTTETGNYRLYGLNVVSFSTDDPTIGSSNATFVDPNNASVPIAIRKK